MKSLIIAPSIRYHHPSLVSLRFFRDNLLSSPPFSSSTNHSRSLNSMATAASVHSSLRAEIPQLSQHPNGSRSDDARVKFVTFRRPISHNGVRTAGTDEIWHRMREEALSDVSQEPILSDYYRDSVLSHCSLESALANHLSIKLSISSLASGTLYDVLFGVFAADQEIMAAVREDLTAVLERDPACVSYTHCFLNFKGFLAIQCHRIAHKLWVNGRRVLALLIQNRVSEVFAVDIHPGAKMGRGILLDHATGLVVGETAVIGNNVSILHNVTLGGTGKASGDRHPKIGDGVLIGAGTCILGNIRVGEGAKIGAGSVVLKDVPPRTTAVGNPARLIGGKENPVRLDKIPGLTMDHTSHISDWSDYVI